MTSDHGTVVRLDFPVERQAEATGEPVAQPIMPMGAGSSG
jgi:hypothetical protein